MQGVVTLLHQTEILSADDAAIRLGLRTFTHVKVIDADQRDVVAPDWLDTAIRHRLSPLAAVRFDVRAVKMEGDDVTSLVNDCLTSFCLRSTFPNPCADRHPSAAAFATELRDWLDESKKRRLTMWIIAAIVVLGMLVAGVVIALGSGQDEGDSFIQNGIMHFDGKTRIVTEVERTLPVTLEAWVKPDRYTGENCQFVIGNDIPGKFGVGIGICGSHLSAEYIDGMINSSASVMPGEWSHVCGVYTESETRLYLNGKLVATGPGSGEGVPAKFVIGNVGEDNLLYFFRGQIRSVRISEGDRYDRDRFDPPSELVGEESTLLAVSKPRHDGNSVLTTDGEVVGRVERLTATDH